MSKVPIDEQIKALEDNIKYREEKGESIDELLDQLRALKNEKSQNYSKAHDSQISDPSIDDLPITQGQLKDIVNDMATQFQKALMQLEESTTKRVNDLSASYQQALNETAQSITHGQPQKGKYDEIISSVVEIAKQRFSEQQPQSNDFERMLMENYKNEALESINIVSLINKKVKAALTGSIAHGISDEIVKTSVPKINHGP